MNAVSGLTQKSLYRFGEFGQHRLAVRKGP